MIDSLFAAQSPLLEIVLRTTLVYLVFIAVVRLGGRREVGQVTIFDLAALVLAANAVQPAMTGPDSSITGGVIILITITLLNKLVERARAHIPLVGQVFEFRGRAIARDGHWLNDAIKREGLDDEELVAALREHGLLSVEDVQLAVLEADGQISIVTYSGGRSRRGRARTAAAG
jgi:uncharacterized membrane protein YcaP (DUF421 family)